MTHCEKWLYYFQNLYNVNRKLIFPKGTLKLRMISEMHTCCYNLYHTQKTKTQFGPVSGITGQKLWSLVINEQLPCTLNLLQTLPTLIRMCKQDKTWEERVEGAETLAYLIEVDLNLQKIAAISDQIIYLPWPSISSIRVAPRTVTSCLLKR